MKKYINDNTGIVVIIVLIVIIGFLINMVINYITSKEKTYEYALNGEIFESNKCYLKKDITYCESDGKMIVVDNYYEID